MIHEGKALAADELDGHQDGHPWITSELASVHVRVVVTWLVIFPMVAAGMSVLSVLAPLWHPVIRALVLTLIVVPTAVYLAVPRLLSLYLLAHRRIAQATAKRVVKRAKRVAKRGKTVTP